MPVQCLMFSVLVESLQSQNVAAALRKSVSGDTKIITASIHIYMASHMVNFVTEPVDTYLHFGRRIEK